MTDRRVEELAGKATASHIRRIFYDVEELNELHLSILDGVNDRYQTPHCSNLQKFSRRPIGSPSRRFAVTESLKSPPNTMRAKAPPVASRRLTPVATAS